MNIFIWLWLGAIVLFGVAEMVTESMVSIWFVAGSLAALVTCMSGWALGGLTAEATQVLVLGMVAKVTEAVDNDRASGAVYVDGKTWSARSADGTVIPAGTQVKVEKIEGVKLLVHTSEKLEVAK